VMAISGLVLSRDPAATLATTLGLGSGVVLGALLGGLFGVWLVLGGRRRLATTAGFFIGIAVILAAWRLAQPSMWMVDIVMREVFGEGGDQYSGFALFLIAIPLLRTIAGSAAAFVGGLLVRQRA